jgi:hypothetical protein
VNVVSWLRRARRRSALRRTRRAAGPRSGLAHQLAGLSTPQLCALWRKSLAGLYAAATPAARAKVASARGILLEELERREPEPMAEWLEAGAVEPEGPPAYLVRR